MRKFFILLSILLIAGLLYLLLWPVPVQPVAWDAPANPGYTGEFAVNHKLKGMRIIPLGNYFAPETVVEDPEGLLYTGTFDGSILKIDPTSGTVQKWVDTKGRILGMAFDGEGNLIAANAFGGLLKISPDKRIETLASEAEGVPFAYLNSVDVAPNGKIYFTDSSTKFSAATQKDTYKASLLDLMEHGGHGRLLEYDPANQTTRVLISNLNFPNGVALSADGSFLLMTETGTYQVIKYWLSGEKKGNYEVILKNIPAFPDNIIRGKEGRFWVALASPRSKALDALSKHAFLRKVVERLPAFMRPKAVPYGHILAIDGEGKILANLQDPEAGFPVISNVTESDRVLYLGSLHSKALGIYEKSAAGL